MNTILEQAHHLPILRDTDVVVVGGGIAGVAAALAAARVRGTRVCLLERYCELGGLATLGNVVIYLALCDGCGHQVIGGISEELARLAVSQETEDIPGLGIKRVPPAWDNPHATLEQRREHRFETSFNPTTFAVLMERLLLKNHVKLYYDSRFSTVIKENDRVKAVIFESKSGRCAITCKAVVDCTGSADVCAAAGEHTVNCNANSRCGWYYYTAPDGTTKLRAATDDFNNIYFQHNSRKLPAFGENTVDGVTSQVIASRDFSLKDLEQLSQKDGRKYQMLHPVSMPTFRMSRRLAGRITLNTNHDHYWFRDTLGFTGDWRKAGPIYPLPLGALAAVKTRNLITAGRCISSTGDTWDVTRVIPTCGVTGEIAGLAAALLASGNFGTNIAKMDTGILRALLIKKNNIIDRNLISTPKNSDE